MSDPDFTQSETMADCTFCGSGVFEYLQVYYQKTGIHKYCRTCWIDIFGGKLDATRQN